MSKPHKEKLPFSGLMRRGEDGQIWIDELPAWRKRIGYGGKLWPTPMARLGVQRGAQGKRYAQKGRSIELDDAVDFYGPTDAPAGVTVMFPTPRSGDWRAGSEEGRTGRTNGINLVTAARFYPTPTTQDAHNNAGPAQSKRNSLPLNAVAGGSLNPEWVCWLMGFPIDWTKGEK